MKVLHDLKTGKSEQLSAVPGGAYGQISFRRLVEQLRKAGEFREGEQITHLHFDFDRNMVRMRFE